MTIRRKVNITIACEYQTTIVVEGPSSVVNSLNESFFEGENLSVVCEHSTFEANSVEGYVTHVSSEPVDSNETEHGLYSVALAQDQNDATISYLGE